MAMAYGAPGLLDLDLSVPPDWEPTPPEVAAALDAAYGGRQSWVGEELNATSAEGEKAAAAGTCLTYGEVHQDGLTKLLGRRGLDLEGRGARCLLELGCGRGRLVLQAFLQFPSLRRVAGVELVGNRHRTAVAAARQLQEQSAGRFRIEVGTDRGHWEDDAGQEPGKLNGAADLRLVEGAGAEARHCELKLASLLDIPDEDLSTADAILLEVVMPPGPGTAAAHERLCSRLAALCKHGCVVASYEDLHALWRALPAGAPECPFHKLEMCEGGFATSWSPIGHRFHGFICDRKQPASVGPGIRL